MARKRPILRPVDQGLGMFHPQPDGKGFGFHPDLAFRQNGIRIAGTVTNPHQDNLGWDFLRTVYRD